MYLIFTPFAYYIIFDSNVFFVVCFFAEKNENRKTVKFKEGNIYMIIIFFYVWWNTNRYGMLKPLGFLTCVHVCFMKHLYRHNMVLFSNFCDIILNNLTVITKKE